MKDNNFNITKEEYLIKQSSVPQLVFMIETQTIDINENTVNDLYQNEDIVTCFLKQKRRPSYMDRDIQLDKDLEIEKFLNETTYNYCLLSKQKEMKLPKYAQEYEQDIDDTTKFVIYLLSKGFNISNNNYSCLSTIFKNKRLGQQAMMQDKQNNFILKIIFSKLEKKDIDEIKIDNQNLLLYYLRSEYYNKFWFEFLAEKTNLKQDNIDISDIAQSIDTTEKYNMVSKIAKKEGWENDLDKYLKPILDNFEPKEKVAIAEEKNIDINKIISIEDIDIIIKKADLESLKKIADKEIETKYGRIDLVNHIVCSIFEKKEVDKNFKGLITFPYDYKNYSQALKTIINKKSNISTYFKALPEGVNNNISSLAYLTLLFSLKTKEENEGKKRTAKYKKELFSELFNLDSQSVILSKEQIHNDIEYIKQINISISSQFSYRIDNKDALTLLRYMDLISSTHSVDTETWDFFFKNLDQVNSEEENLKIKADSLFDLAKSWTFSRISEKIDDNHKEQWSNLLVNTIKTLKEDIYYYKKLSDNDSFLNTNTLKATIMPSLLDSFFTLNKKQIISKKQDFDIIQKTAKVYLKEGQLKTGLEKQFILVNTNQEKKNIKIKTAL